MFTKFESELFQDTKLKHPIWLKLRYFQFSLESDFNKLKKSKKELQKLILNFPKQSFLNQKMWLKTKMDILMLWQINC